MPGVLLPSHGRPAALGLRRVSGRRLCPPPWRGREGALSIRLYTGYNTTLNYTFSTIFSHIEQLAPTVRRNADVIYALQAGFVGAWGEWHDSLNKLEANNTALGQLLWAELSQMLPPDIYVQIRSPAHKALALRASPQEGPLRFGVADSGSVGSGAAFARVGYHNDGFLSYVPGVTPWPASDGMTWFADAPVGICGSGVLPLACTADGGLLSGDFALMAHESHWVTTDAEMFPWAGLRTPFVDGHTAAHRARMHHHTTLSIAHGLGQLDNPPVNGSGGGVLSETIDAWMSQPLNVTRLSDCGGPPGYPCNLPTPYDYTTVPHTTFEYIRDFLGYRAQLTEAAWNVVGGGARLVFSGTVVNWGFAAPVAHRTLRLALVDASPGGRGIVAWVDTGADAASWMPHVPHDPLFAPVNHTVSGALELAGLPAGNYSAGLWLPEGRNASTMWAMRLANAPCDNALAAGPLCGVFWWAPPIGEGGVNVFGTVSLH